MGKERGVGIMSKFSKKKLYASIAVGTVIACLSAGLFVTVYSKPVAATEEILVVRTKTIQTAGAGQSYTYSGEVCGKLESQLAFQIGGKIIKRYVELGSTVKPGDVLMEVNAKDVEQTVNINSAQVYTAQSQLKLAETNLNRYRQLYEQNAISRAQLDQYQNAYETAVSGVRQASAQYSQGTNQLGYSKLVADREGVISNITAEAGQVVSAGQVVVTLVENSDREIEINVPENRIEELRKSQHSKVTFWALPNVTIDAKIKEIAPMADKISRTYKVRLSLINPPQEVKLGMTATVTITGAGGGQVAVHVPLSAIYQNGQVPNVWVVNEGVASLRPIKVGAFGNEEVEVVEGLHQGDVIVTAGVHKLREGQKVRNAGDSL
jgi:multidrug efflux system membrane fusion protein